MTKKDAFYDLGRRINFPQGCFISLRGQEAMGANGYSETEYEIPGPRPIEIGSIHFQKENTEYEYGESVIVTLRSPQHDEYHFGPKAERACRRNLRKADIHLGYHRDHDFERFPLPKYIRKFLKRPNKAHFFNEFVGEDGLLYAITWDDDVAGLAGSTHVNISGKGNFVGEEQYAKLTKRMNDKLERMGAKKEEAERRNSAVREANHKEMTEFQEKNRSVSEFEVEAEMYRRSLKTSWPK